MKENQKQRHQPNHNQTKQNTEKLTRTMIKTQVLIAEEKFNHQNDSKGPVVKKENSKKYQTIVLVFLKVNGKGRRMQRQIYRDRFVAVTKIAYFGPLGAKIAFWGLASLALRFQWFRRNFVDVGNTVFRENEARHQKTQKSWWARHHKYILPFFPKPRFWPSCCKFDTVNVKKPIFPAVLGICAHCKKETGFTPYPTQKKMPYVKSDNLPWRASFSAWCPEDDARYFARPRE